MDDEQGVPPWQKGHLQMDTADSKSGPTERSPWWRKKSSRKHMKTSSFPYNIPVNWHIDGDHIHHVSIILGAPIFLERPQSMLGVTPGSEAKQWSKLPVTSSYFQPTSWSKTTEVGPALENLATLLAHGTTVKHPFCDGALLQSNKFTRISTSAQSSRAGRCCKMLQAYHGGDLF